jgi:ribosomal protein S6--L-glutamate ligase
MKLWLLTHLETSVSSRYMLDAAVKRGHQVELLNPLRTSLVITESAAGGSVLGKSGLRTLPDAVLTRLGSSSPLAGLHVIREIELRGVPCSNSAWALERSRDKVRCFQELRAAGVPMPKTIAIGPEVAIDSVTAYLAGPPWILKLPVSAQGKGVMVVESLQSLRSIVDAVHALQGSLVLQEFVAESSGADVRVLVLNGEAVAAMRRQAAKGEFRSNLHRGGTPTGIPLTPELASLAERAANVLGLDIAGVDLLETKNGYVLIEVNGSPGLEGLQSVTDYSISERIVEMIERRVDSK